MKKLFSLFVVFMCSSIAFGEGLIMPVGIYFDNNIPVVNRSNPVIVEFYNKGETSVVSVDLYSEQVGEEYLISSVSVDAPSKSSVKANFPWSPSEAKEYRIIALINKSQEIETRITVDVVLDNKDIPQIGGSEIFGEEFMKTLPPYEKPSKSKDGEFLLDSLSVEEVGSQKSFWGTDPRTNGLYEYNTTLVAKGRNCKIYLEEGNEISKKSIIRLMREFDTKIYPQTTGYFGMDPQPGIDNDPRLTIVLLDIPDDYEKTGSFVGGYFSPLNLYPQSALDQHNQQTGASLKSNETEMVAMDIHPGNIEDIKKFGGTLAHEFQHLIHFTHDSSSATWFNEACSQYASYLYNKEHPGQNIFYLKGKTDVSTFFWSQDVASYGAVYLFIYYTAHRYFPDAQERMEFFQYMVNSQGKKQKSLEYMMGKLKEKRPELTLEQLFSEWSVAMLIDDKNSEYYGYADTLDMKSIHLPEDKRFHRIPVPFQKSSVKFFGLDYITVSQNYSKGEYLNFKPENPSYKDRITFSGEKPGQLVWGINGWETPIEQLWPEGSEKRKSGAIGTPLTFNSETGKYEVTIGSFENHYVDSVDYVFLYEDNTYDKKSRPIVLIPYDPGQVDLSSQSWKFEQSEGFNGKYIITAVERYADNTVSVKHFTDVNNNFSWPLKNISEKGGEVTFIVSAFPAKNFKSAPYQYSVGSDLDFLALKSEKLNALSGEFENIIKMEETILSSLQNGDYKVLKEMNKRPGVIKNLKRLRFEIQKFITIKTQGREKSGKLRKFLEKLR